MARDNKNPGSDLVTGRNPGSKETAHAVRSGRRETVLCETLKL